MSVVIETSLGDLTVDLYLKARPNTCLNFLKLCKIKYYNLCVFHKVERNFVAQTGDPTETGRGGESVFSHLYGDQAKYFDAERKPRLKHEKLGTLSMVNNGNNMNGSQFFITLGENLSYLDDEHTVFGEVAEGFEILLKISEAICDSNNRPYQDIRITHTVILHDPYEDPKGLTIPDASPVPTKEQLESNYIGADEEINDTQGKSMEEIEEKIKENEAKARATILEMVGDIPDAEVKPPDDVLFVCKLNPVTTSEDLDVIFSRFGPIVSCEVIKDKKTGESLQYAFIEFEKEEDCENAYFKMDNVLIDDRRIHVDFSQSVSKLNWKDGKPSKERLRKDNLVIKNASKSDGYNMIFDMNDSSSRASPKRRQSKEKSKTSEYKSSSKSYDTDKYPSKHYSKSSEYKNSARPYDDDKHRSRLHSRSPPKESENHYHRRKNYLPTKHSVSYQRNYKMASSYYDSKTQPYNRDIKASHQKSRSEHVNYSPKLREKEQKHASKKESQNLSNYDTLKRKKSRSSSCSSESDTSDASPAKKSKKKKSNSSTSSDSDSSSSSSSSGNPNQNRKSHSSKSFSHKATNKLDAHKSTSQSRQKSPEHPSKKITKKHSPPFSKRRRNDSSSEGEQSRSPRKEVPKYSSRSDSYDGRRNKPKGGSGQDHRMPPEYSRKEYKTSNKSESSYRDYPHSKGVMYKESESGHHRRSHDYESSLKKQSSEKKKQYRRSPS